MFTRHDSCYRHPMRTLALTFLAAGLLALPGCSTVAKGGASATGMAAQGAVAVAEVPLEDLNLKREKIPKELKRVERVYPEVPPESCFMIAFEIRELDAVLGPDEDDPSDMADSLSMSARAKEKAGDLAMDGVRDVAADQIPFRDLIRRASGAKRHQQKRTEAYQRGAQRRTYLKGLGDAMGCDEARVKRELYADEEEKKKFLGLF